MEHSRKCKLGGGEISEKNNVSEKGAVLGKDSLLKNFYL